MNNNETLCKFLILQSDFGLTDGAVSAMQGVALSIDNSLKLFNLTHDITPYNIFEASYRLFQSVEYWPRGTVFVSVVDPGVGSNRKSVVARTSMGHYIVTPDNGALTHLKRFVGITAVREIDEAKHRRKDTEYSYTFHGRDVYAFTGAKLASGATDFEDIGPELTVSDIVEVEIGEVAVSDGFVSGCVDILDGCFGSLWTNITKEDFFTLGVSYGDEVELRILSGSMPIYHNRIRYGHSFADVHIGEPLTYVNSLGRMGVAINQGNFARAYSIGVGVHWHIEFRRIEK